MSIISWSGILLVWAIVRVEMYRLYFRAFQSIEVPLEALVMSLHSLVPMVFSQLAGDRCWHHQCCFVMVEEREPADWHLCSDLRNQLLSLWWGQWCCWHWWPLHAKNSLQVSLGLGSFVVKTLCHYSLKGKTFLLILFSWYNSYVWPSTAVLRFWSGNTGCTDVKWGMNNISWLILTDVLSGGCL